jgi:hypothetical protein
MWYLTFHRWVGDPDEAIESSLDDHLTWIQAIPWDVQQLVGAEGVWT